MRHYCSGWIILLDKSSGLSYRKPSIEMIDRHGVCEEKTLSVVAAYSSEQVFLNFGFYAFGNDF